MAQTVDRKYTHLYIKASSETKTLQRVFFFLSCIPWDEFTGQSWITTAMRLSLQCLAIGFLWGITNELWPCPLQPASPLIKFIPFSLCLFHFILPLGTNQLSSICQPKKTQNPQSRVFFLMCNFKQGGASCRKTGRGNYIHLKQGLAYVFTSSCSLCDRLHLRSDVWAKQWRNIYFAFMWAGTSGQAGTERVWHHRGWSVGFLSSSQGSHGLLSNPKMCFDSCWSWKWARGLPLCLIRGQSCRHTVWKWKAKWGCFSAKCFSSEPSRPLFKPSKGASHPQLSSFPLSLSPGPSFLTLFSEHAWA